MEPGVGCHGHRRRCRRGRRPASVAAVCRSLARGPRRPRPCRWRGSAGRSVRAGRSRWSCRGLRVHRALPRGGRVRRRRPASARPVAGRAPRTRSCRRWSRSRSTWRRWPGTRGAGRLRGGDEVEPVTAAVRTCPGGGGSSTTTPTAAQAPRSGVRDGVPPGAAVVGGWPTGRGEIRAGDGRRVSGSTAGSAGGGSGPRRSGAASSAWRSEPSSTAPRGGPGSSPCTQQARG